MPDMGRTYVRRRGLSLALLVLALTAPLTGPVAHALGGAPASRPVGARTYVVREGDSLWSIAERQAGGRDPRPLVDAIEQANHIDAGSLVPGMSLAIPAVP